MFKLLVLTIGLYNITGLSAQVKNYKPASQEDSISAPKPGAWYNGDIKELAKTIEKKYAGKKIQPSGDSSVTFKAFVDKHLLNNLQEIELIEGSKSAFSDLILHSLRDSGKVWRSMIMGGRLVKSFIRVQARLNSDGSIFITTDNYIGSLPQESFRDSNPLL